MIGGILVVLLSWNIAVSSAALATAFSLTRVEEEQQKENLGIVEIEKIKLTAQQRRSIPYIGVRPYYVPQKYLSNSHEKILTMNNKAIGAIGYYYWICGCDSTATIINIGIKPRYQKKGYGTYLMKHILEEIKSQKTKIVTIRAMCGSTPFFRKLGFKSIGKNGFMQFTFSSPPTSPSSETESIEL